MKPIASIKYVLQFKHKQRGWLYGGMCLIISTRVYRFWLQKEQKVMQMITWAVKCHPFVAEWTHCEVWTKLHWDRSNKFGYWFETWPWRWRNQRKYRQCSYYKVGRLLGKVLLTRWYSATVLTTIKIKKVQKKITICVFERAKFFVSYSSTFGSACFFVSTCRLNAA